MRKIDLNCDMGEGSGHDDTLMPYISSANIACGYHAGDAGTMWQTVELAIKHQVAVGAHVSFLDREDFGRREQRISLEEVYELVEQQLLVLREITEALGVPIRHVKPHGALYNMSARDAELAKTIARAVKDVDHTLCLYGLSGSFSIREATAAGLQTASEVFADRTYQEDGSLTPRSQPHALISTETGAINQVMQMLGEGRVTTLSGKEIPIVAETICIHGDGENAPALARALHEALQRGGFLITAPGRAASARQ